MSDYHFHDEDGSTFSEYDLEEQYAEMLDDVYGVANIAGYEYETSDALKALDPIAFRVGFADYTSEFEECFEECFDEES